MCVSSADEQLTLVSIQIREGDLYLRTLKEPTVVGVRHTQLCGVPAHRAAWCRDHYLRDHAPTPNPLNSRANMTMDSSSALTIVPRT
jgi:hypothetical protein